MKETASAGCGRRFKQFLRAILLGLLCAASVEAQEAHLSHYELGKVDFPVS
jgi:hypothetical protein